MASNPMQQFTVRRIGPEINIAGVDLSFTNASLFMVISATVIILFLFLGSKEKKIIPNKLQLIASKAVHGLFYVTLLLITISGILKLLLSGEEVNFIISKVYIDYFNYELADQFHVVHVISAYFLVLLFTIHLGAVVYHHLIQKDPILKKML